MTRKSNKGVSIVEILIALAVFVILLVPIVSSLITGMKTTTSAKELQYRNEYARNLMENVKEVPLSVLDTAAGAADPSIGPAVDYFKSMGARNVQVSKTGSKYLITGNTNIGTENTEYAFQIEVDGANYSSVSNLKNGVVEDLDQTKVALISAPLSNYDYSAYDALLTKKMAQLQQGTTNYNSADGIVKFNNDTCSRTINITVNKSGNKYEVKCILEYRDRSNCTEVTDVLATYVPYCQEFDELPNIYLMYNACVYNNRYAANVTISGVQYLAETINLDVNGGVQDPVNVFVIATPSETDYRNIAGTKRPDVNFVKNDNDKNICVYHNFASLDDPTIPTDDNNGITPIFKNFKSGQYGDLNDAMGGRSLYEVRIRMQKGSSVDTGIDPILQGTRGGDEIE